MIPNTRYIQILLYCSIFPCIYFAITKENYGLMFLPVLLALAFYFARDLILNPYLFLIFIAFSYVVDVPIKVGPLSINILLVSSFCMAFLLQKSNWVLIESKRILVSLLLYIILIQISSYLTNNHLGFRDINIYVNSFIIMLMFFVLDEKNKIKLFENAIVFGALVLVVLGTISAIKNGIPREGVTAHFANHVPYALHIAWAVPIIVCRLIIKLRVTNLFLLLLLCIGLALAASRGVILSLILSGIIMYILFAIKTPIIKRFFFISFMLVIIVTVITVLSIDPDFLYEATSGRTMLFIAAWEMFKDNLLFGTGWGGYRLNWSNYVNVGLFSDVEGVDELTLFPHNSYLMIVSQLGIVGMFLYTLLNYFICKKAFYYRDLPGIKPYIWMLLFYYTFGMFDNHAYGDERFFYMLTGIISVLIYNAKFKVKE